MKHTSCQVPAPTCFGTEMRVGLMTLRCY